MSVSFRKIPAWSATAVITACLSVAAFAQEDGWSGKGEGGISLVSGNSESEIITAGLEIGKKSGSWDHSAELSIIRSESAQEDEVTGALGESEKTADALLVGWESRYSFGAHSYAYGEVRYLDDKFDSFEAVKSASVGYGYKILRREDVKWNISLGLGYRDTEYDDNVTDAELAADGLMRDIGEATLVGVSKYTNKLTDNTTFTNDTRIEGGAENSYVQNVTALGVSMTDTLALKLKLDIRHNTEPAPEDVSTDRITSVNIVYSF